MTIRKNKAGTSQFVGKTLSLGASKYYLELKVTSVQLIQFECFCTLQYFQCLAGAGFREAGGVAGLFTGETGGEKEGSVLRASHRFQ